MGNRAVKHSATFDMRLEPRVKNALEELAEFHGLTQSGYLRMMILREVNKLMPARA